MKTIINGKNYPVTQTGNRFFYFSSKAGRKLPVSKKDVIFEEPKENSNNNNTNFLKSKKMRNLIILAVAYAVALTESDVMELGYNVTEEDFKGYFEIPEDAQRNEFRKDEDFSVEKLSKFMNPEEEKEFLKPSETAENSTENSEATESKKETQNEEIPEVAEASAGESAETSEANAEEGNSEEISKLEKELEEKKSKLAETKNANSKKKLQREIEVAEEEIANLKNPKPAKSSKKSEKKPKEEKPETPKKTKEEKWAEAVEYGKQFDEGDSVSFVDYKTKETINGVFKKHTKFWDDFPGANVQITIKGAEGEKDTKKTKILSYNSLTLVKKAEPAPEPAIAEKVEEKKEEKKSSKKSEKTEK